MIACSSLSVTRLFFVVLSILFYFGILSSHHASLLFLLSEVRIVIFLINEYLIG